MLYNNFYLYITLCQSKLDWLKNELREQRDKEQRLRLDVRDVVCTSEKDRQYLVAEIHRQNDVLDQLANQNLGTLATDLLLDEHESISSSKYCSLNHCMTNDRNQYTYFIFSIEHYSIMCCSDVTDKVNSEMSARNEAKWLCCVTVNFTIFRQCRIKYVIIIVDSQNCSMYSHIKIYTYN